MARFDDVARERTDLSEADLDHLRALVADWTLLSDLAFADLERDIEQDMRRAVKTVEIRDLQLHAPAPSRWRAS